MTHTVCTHLHLPDPPIAVCAKKRTTKGRKLIRWTHDELNKLHELYASGMKIQLISMRLNIPVERIKQRIKWESQGAQHRLTRKQRRAAQRAETKAEQKTPRVFIDRVVSSPQPTPEAIKFRDMKAIALPRDLAGLVFNDPPMVFSALDRKLAGVSV